MPSSVTIMKTTSFGSTLKVTLEPMSGERVRVLEYYRRSKNGAQFKRVPAEEGQVITFAQLQLEESFGDLFSLEAA